MKTNKKNSGTPANECNVGTCQKIDKPKILDPDLDLRHKQRMGFSINDLPNQKARLEKWSLFFLFMALVSTVVILIVLISNGTVTQGVFFGLSLMTSLSGSSLACVHFFVIAENKDKKMTEFQCWRWIPENSEFTIDKYWIMVKLFYLVDNVLRYEQSGNILCNSHQPYPVDLPAILYYHRRLLSEELDSFLKEIERRFGLRITRKEIAGALTSGKQPQDISFVEITTP